MEVRSYRDLEVWKRAVDWAGEVDRVSAAWPAHERYGLTSQARRAAVSVAANLAEGWARRTTGEFLQFIGIAKGSLAEAETHLILSVRFSYTSAPEVDQLLAHAEATGRMLSRLTASLRARKSETR